MRRGLWLWLLCASAACGADHEWPPPPDNAAASCVYEYREPSLRAQDVSKSTLYLDADDRVFRIDGQEENTSRYHDSDPLDFKATYYMEYDELGRLVEETGPIAVRVTYDGDYVLVQGPGTSSRRLTLADGHVVHEESTPGWPSTTDLAYDSSGRLASASMTGYDDRLGMVTKLLNYTYDAQNRVVEIEDTSNLGIAGPQPTSTSHITYTETPSQFVIQWGSQTRRFDFDDEGRIIYAAVDYGYQKHPPIEESVVSAFTYGDDFIEETSTWNAYDRYGYVTVIRATGRCPMPSFRTAPSPPLPISWSADYVQFDERAASELFPTPQ